MNNIFKINKKLSLVVFVLSLLCFSTFDSNLNQVNILPICFLLIATFGVSHGSLDHLKGYKVLKFYKIKQKSIFYLSYILFSLLVIFFWIFFPLFTLIIFLMIASYHFGKEDSEFGKIQQRKYINFYFFFKGSIVILAPLLVKPVETLRIFEVLNVSLNPYNNNIVIFLISLSLLSNFFINKNIVISMIDSFTIIILNITFSPLIAFTFYFCFLHSIRHSISLISKLDKRNLKLGAIKFFKKALPLTLITALIFISSVYLLNNYFTLNEAILKVIFIGLASLTFPHILLEYLLEKNEK